MALMVVPAGYLILDDLRRRGLQQRQRASELFGAPAS